MSDPRWRTCRVSPAALALTLAIAVGFARANVQDPEAEATSPTRDVAPRLAEIRRLGGEAARLYGQGRYAEATDVSRRTVAACEEALGGRHPTTAAALSNLALMLVSQGDLAAARPLYERALMILKEAHEEPHPAIATCENNLAELLKGQGDYAAARRLHSRALASRERIFGRNHPETAQSLNNLALLEYATGDYAAARPLLERALPVYREAFGRQHATTVSALNNLAGVLVALGDLAAARPLYEEVLEDGKQAFGADHPAYASLLTGMAELLRKQGDFAEARPYYERALDLRKRSLGESHPDTAQGYDNLAVILVEQGDYAAARPLFDRALASYRASFGGDHPSCADVLSNLADLLKIQGDDTTARSLGERALAIREASLGRFHPDTASTLNNLAMLLADQGDYASARPLYERALAIREKVFGPRHEMTVGSLHNLACLLISQGDAEAARPLLDRVLRDLRAAPRPDPHKMAVALNSLAFLRSRRGDEEGARTLYQESLEIRRRSLGPDHPDTAVGMNNLAAVLCSLGDFDAASLLYEQALAVHRKAYGEGHATTAIGLSNLAVLRWRRGDAAGAEPLLRRALTIARDNLELAAAGQSERQQLIMSRQLRAQLDGYLSLPDPARPSAEDLYRSVLAWKGAVHARQRRARVLRRVVGAAGRPEIAALADQLEATARGLATLALSTPGPDRLPAWRRQVGELSSRKERLEAELAKVTAGSRIPGSPDDSDPERLKRSLPADSALVDLLDFEHFGPGEGGVGKLRRGRRMVAFVVRPGRAVVRIDLGPSAPVEAAVDGWDSARRGGADLSKAGPAAELRELVWLRLEPALAGARVVLVSPDGALARVPMAGLPGREPGTYLIQERAFATVPVPKEIPGLLDGPGPEAARPTPALLLVGDVDYDANPGQGDAGDIGREAIGRSRDGGGGRFSRLPATGREVEAVGDSFARDRPGASVEVLRGGGATEAALRRSAPRSRFLHLATHGYFADRTVRSALDVPPQDLAATPGQMAGEADPFGGGGVVGFHPGLLSGLALAGANRAWAPGQDDGVLTASEVAEIDLSGVELAVLSACQTGLGAESRGEGLIGLQRAFQVAGARSVVAAMWSVDDEATRALMVRFYDNLSRSPGRIEALREAQLWMLRGGGRDDPAGRRGLEPLDGPAPPAKGGRGPGYDWAAFVLSGDWR